MSVMEVYTLFWLLPSLIAFLMASDVMRRFEFIRMERWNAQDWLLVIFCSVIYPFGFLAWIVKNSDALTKERQFKS